MATKLLPVMRRSQHEAEDAVETLLRQSFMKMKTKMNKMQETKVKGLELLGDEEYEWMMQALLFSILSDDPNSNSNSNSKSSASALAMTHLKLIVGDGYTALVRIVRRVVEESFPKLLQQSKQQLIWLFRHLVQLSANECEILTISLLRRIQGGADMSHANLWLALELLYVLQTNSPWLMRNTHGVLVASVFCYLRLLSDHCRICPGGNSSSSRILGILKKSEIEFCARVLRQCLRECLGIGRDLLRLLRDVVGFVPEVESVWNDLVGNPASFRVLGFSDVSQIYWSRTSSRFSVYRISPEMEIQLRFLLTHVRWGSQRRYLTWFGAKFLATPESETLIPDVIRFICCAHHPSNEILQSDVIARWAVIGWLLKCCRSPQVHYNARLALFYDWLFFNDKTDNVMNIEPAILLMLHSLPKYADITVSLLEFLLAAVDNYVSHKKALVQRSVCAAFHVLLNKGVVVSLEPLLLSHLICPALRNKLSVLLSLEQANHAAATKLNNYNDPILNSQATASAANKNNHNNKRPFSDNAGIENDGDSPKAKLRRMEERVLLSDSAFPLMPPSLVSKPSSVNVEEEEENTVDVDAINEKNKGVEQPRVLISDVDPRLMSTSLVSTHVSEHVAIENDVDVTEQEKVHVNDSHILLPDYSSPSMAGSLVTTPVSGCATVACNTDAVNLKTSSAEEPQVLVPTSASPLLAASAPANAAVESDSNSTEHKRECVEEFEALELRIIIEALKGSRDMKLMALDRLEKFIMCSLGVCNSTLGCPEHDDIFCTKEIKSRALQLANSLESGGQKMFLPLNCCTVSLEDDDEVVSATAAVLCMYTLFPHPNFQAMLVIWEKNGWAVGSRLLCYVCRLADELAELLALKDTTEKIEDSLTGLERQTADSYFDRCDAIQNLVLLKRHSYKHNKYTKPKGKQSNMTQYHKELDLSHLVALVEGAFKSYREFLNATAQGYAAPNVSEGNTRKTSTVEKSDAFSIFLDNLRTCCLWSIPRLFVSLKNIFQRLPDLSVGQKCVVELLVSFLVPSETLKFEKKLIMQEFSIFGKNPLVICSLVKASLEWECTEQQLFWQLLVSDVHAHTVSVAHSLLSFCSRTLDPKQHGCAISGLLIFLRCQPPCIELVKAIVCVPIELADSAASVILSWCATNQSMLLKCLQDSVEFCSPKTGDVSNGCDPSETTNVLTIRSIMSFLDKQIFSGRSNILEIKTCLSEFTNKISYRNTIISENGSCV